MEQFFLVWPNLMLIFCRITAFFVTVPVYSSRNVPITFKIGFSVFMTFIIFAILGTSNPVPMDSQYVLLILREILVGVLLGFLVYLFFTAVQTAGSFMDIQIGFGIANVIDPMTGASAPMIGNLKYMIAMLLFLAFDGHHFLIRAIIESYQWIPIQNELFARIYNGQISEFLFKSFSAMFYLAFQLAAPVIAVMFLTDLGLGLLTRVAPQFNVFVVGAPLKMILGFMVIIIVFPELITMFHGLFVTIEDSIYKLMRLISLGG
ncbi:flagellar biosynthetic protein FliR [Paenibacillus sp. GP183]|uniref:flagellar biosynthetic protein FliR n=1 Tax=Paenibacillus sp. GP183 TaxID=1882751 RepID=UPI000899DEB8|nr:flagellar biosynthetic protein FliR [Paenibacillus sp. GP183]SEB47098.1 flagellar biosynthetic protein FliR [Paenibacillus sp. GP183]